MTEQNKNKKTRITGIVLIILITAAAGAVAFTFIGKDDTNGPGGRSGGRPGAGNETAEAVSQSVLVETMAPSVMENYLKFNGDVIAETSVDIYPDTAGKLTKLTVSLGDYVKKGEVIAEVDPSLPGQVYVASPVRSTISGIITDLPNKVGSTIATTQTPIATVGDLADLQLDSYISEKYMASVKLGQYAEISFEPFADIVFSGTVVEISPVLDKTSRTLEIKLDLENSNDMVKSGMFAAVRLITETKENTITIPSESLMDGDDCSFVYIVNSDNLAVKTCVETGLELDGRIEILNGLSAGDQVIIRGQSMIQDGSAVKISE